MVDKTVQKYTELTDHPLEDFFDVAPSSTEVDRIERTTELVRAEEYDEKDSEIEENFQEVYDRAMESYDKIQETIEDVDARFTPRSHEVANQILGTALAAAVQKADLKKHKDKLAVAKQNVKTPGTVNNTLVVDTKTLVQQLRQAGAIEVLSSQVVETTEQPPTEQNAEDKNKNNPQAT
jgi:hypothetical protein